MKTYKAINLETRETFIWTAQEILELVNSDRSDEWTDYTLEDLQDNPNEVLGWAKCELVDPHHPDCPAFDGFGCRCEEIERNESCPHS